MKKIIHIGLFIAAALVLYHLLPSPQSAAARLEGTATRTGYPTRTRTKFPTRTSTATATASPTATATSTATATPVGLYAWMDPDLDLRNLHPAAPLVLHFSYPVDPASAGDQPALLTLPWVEGKTTWDETFTTLTFKPDTPFTPRGQYQVFLNTDLRDMNGQALNDTTTNWQISVSSGPKVTVPKSVAAGTDRHMVTKVTFDRAMNTASVATALSVQPPAPVVLGWHDNTLAITSTQVLTPGMQLTFNLAGNATDARGAPLGDEYTWSYRLAAFAARASVMENLGGKRALKIVFNYPVDHALVEKALRFTPALEGDRSWEKDVLRIVPQNPVDTWAVYEIRFDGVLQDTAGNPIPALDPIKFVPPIPVITEKYSDPQYTFLDDVHSPLELRFAIALDHASVEAAFRIEPAVVGTFSWRGNSLIFQPDRPLEWDRRYTVTILPGAKGETGKPFLAAAYTHVFVARLRAGDTGFGVWGANLQLVDADGPRAIQFQDGKATGLEFALYQFDLPTFIDRYREYFRIEDQWSSYPVIPVTDGVKVAAWPWKREQDNQKLVPDVYLPQEVKPGFYLLEMYRDSSLVGQLFVVLTRNTLVVKQSGDELLTWVSDINGESVAGIEVRLYSTRGEKLRVSQTDENGIYRTTVPQGYEPLLVVARTPDGDFAVSGLQGMWITDYSKYYWFSHPVTASPPVFAYVYTDRPIYRPGQTVYFKVITRLDNDVKYSLLEAGTPVTVSVQDGRQNVLQTIELATNAFGSVNGEFQLTDGAMLGIYTLKAEVQGHIFSQAFKVQEYRKPDIQVSISTDAAQYVSGDKITISVDANY